MTLDGYYSAALVLLVAGLMQLVTGFVQRDVLMRQSALVWLTLSTVLAGMRLVLWVTTEAP